MMKPVTIPSIPHEAIIATVASIAIFVLFPLLYTFVRKYLLFPLKWRRKNFECTPRIEAVSPEEIPPEASLVISEAILQLRAMRFEFLGHVHYRSIESPTTHVYGSYLSHRGDAVTAHVAAVFVQFRRAARGETMKHDFVTFSSKFADDSLLTTSNGPGNGAFEASDKTQSIGWTGMKELGRLYAFHLARVRLGQNPRSVTPPPLDVEEAIQRVRSRHENFLMWRARVRLIELSADRATFHYTTGGAYKTVWRVLFPMKQMTARRKTAALWTELHRVRNHEASTQ